MRASFRGDVGFLLAAAGSAIGLGNIWKFPYIAGMNGGGIFVLFYLGCALVVALPVMIAEIAIGQQAQSNAINSFDIIEKRPSRFKLSGILGCLACYLIISFYSAIGGWIIFYLYKSLSSIFAVSAEPVDQVFNTAVGVPHISLLNQGLFLFITFVIVALGVNKGIEKINKIAIPLLLMILLFLLYTVWGMPGFDKAINFIFNFNTDAFTFKGALEAVGHSFFTVSVGVGIMITYGSYLPKSVHIGRLAIVIVLVDTAIALLSAVVIFSILFSFGQEPGQGPVLMFKTLPALFQNMANGPLVSSAFFLLVLLTAITSAISLIEVPVSYMVDRGSSRSFALLKAGIIVTILGGLCGLSTNLLSETKIFSKTFFDLFDYISSNLLLPTSGLIAVLFFGYRMKKLGILVPNFSRVWVSSVFYFVTRILAPFSIMVIMAVQFLN
jgi:NSS family neurotransmitter:Na+ symporter